MASPVFYRIHDANIHAMHEPGGPVYKLIDDSAIAAKVLAMDKVGERTGKLRNSIRANRPKQEGGFSIAALVYTNVRYALWHHEGTNHIFPKHGRYLTVPRRWSKISGGQLRKEWLAEGSSRGDKPYFLARSISGQKPTPFLREGMEEALARSPYLGFSGMA